MNISILIIVTGSSTINSGGKTGVWLEEFAVPYIMFKKDKINLTITTINGGIVPIDPASIDGIKPEWNDALEALKNAQKLSTVDTSKYQAVYIPGGHGAMFDLADNEIVKQTLVKFADAGKTISAICHGPSALVGVKLKNGKYLVEGKQVTSFTNNEEDEVNMSAKMPFMLESKLKEQGALFNAQDNWIDNVIIDGKLITGQNPNASASIAYAIIKSIKE